jgi:hypothetical protein
MAKPSRTSNRSSLELKHDDVESLHLQMVNDLLLEYGQAPFIDPKECITLGFPKSNDPDTFKIEYLKAEVLSKFNAHPLNIDTEAVAYGSFSVAEDKCKATNEMFRDHSVDTIRGCISRLSCGSVIHTARKKIARILGSFSIGEAASRGRFSPGATLRIPRKDSHIGEKLTRGLECSITAYPYVRSLYETTLLSSYSAKPRICEFNKATTVPKNSKTDRLIAIEPSGNMFFQLGIGSMIRSRLLRVGIDLTDQANNQRLAYEGSITGSFATIDMKAASDTISYEVVKALLPPDWFEGLLAFRSNQGLIKGKLVPYEKFSSMGNGYTFELETLLFYSIASSVCELLLSTNQYVTSYGDDLIVPSDAARAVIEMFSFFGFTTNEKKTFFEGPFRESCGKHYFQGIDVTPFYIRSPITDVPSLLLVLNNLYRWGSASGLMDPRADRVRQKYIRLLPKFWQKNTIPDGLGDSALVGSLLSNPYKKYVPHSGGVFLVRGLRRRERNLIRNEIGCFMASIGFNYSYDREVTLTSATRGFEEFNLRCSSLPAAQLGYPS